MITGGAGLLGVNHARALIQKNCKVELWDVSESGLIQTKHDLEKENFGDNVATRVIDITDETQVEAAVSQYKHDSIIVDILINNAALNPKVTSMTSTQQKNFENYEISLWNHEIGVGLTGSLICSKHIGGYMATHNKGVILNIASDLSVISPDQRIYRKKELPDDKQFKKPVSYSVIKTGLIGLTRYLATYWAEAGIRVNALSPGGVYDSQDENFVEEIIKLIPLGRMAKADEYVGAIQFLCSDASSYMTGQNIVVDGGRSVW